MENDTRNGRKRRKSPETQEPHSKRLDKGDGYHFTNNCKTGKIIKVLVRNFMCHDALEVTFNPNVNFIIGRNGSGKSAILTALTVGLGARATVTSRGSSVKNFIKKGKNTATIQITLFNGGSMPYKPDIYGESITVVRTIGSASTYKIKNWKGTVISTRQKDLGVILKAMNIQIDNPISILNQDISRLFLVSSTPEEKYQLFMKATLLDVIGDNYKEATSTCNEDHEKLKNYSKVVAESEKEIEQLKTSIEKAEGIDRFRDEIISLEKELLWSFAITEEKKLEQAEEIFKKCDDNLKQIQGLESSTGSKDEEIDKKIREKQEEIKRIEEEINNSSEVYNKARQDFSIHRNEHSTKTREWRTAQSKVKRLGNDIATLRKEIDRLENIDNGEYSERNIIKQELAIMEQKLDETDALLRTKQTYQMHLETDKMRLTKDIEAAKYEVNNCENRINKLKREISARKMCTNDAASLFGRNIPRLLRRIEEEHRKGNFKAKPRGPLGLYIKLKNKEWGPAVESFFGPSFLSSFCVDDKRDAKLLSSIVKEIYMNERSPQIICSKFYQKIHDVSGQCVNSEHFSDLLDALDISDPVVANCLIDQREIECILLIPTSREAAEIMCNASTVPRNCKRAFTQKYDMFYPDPHYRSYGGPRNLKSKFLQVSVMDTIKAFEEDIMNIDKERNTAIEACKTASQKEQRIKSELSTVTAEVAKLRNSQNELNASINDLKDKLESNEAVNVTVFRNEVQVLEGQLNEAKEEESRLKKIVSEMQEKLESLEEEVSRCRNLKQTLDTKIYPLQESINALRDEKEELHAQIRYATRRLQTVNQELQTATAHLEQQKRCTTKAVSDAMKKCERVDTQRSSGDLQRLVRETKAKVVEIERQCGNVEELKKELKRKQQKCGKSVHYISRLKKNYHVHLQRLEYRKEEYSKMQKLYGWKIQQAFSDVLSLRNKKGKIHINHNTKVLDLEVHSPNDAKRPMNDTKCLSGGERSYSTVAFILALWECTGLPFYFLDEFDVFMDKVNRRTIMDILLDHTKMHPQSQFTFLTPLDTSTIQIDDSITVHQLSPPERASQVCDS